MSVGGNVAYGLKVKKVPSEERRRRVEEALDTLLSIIPVYLAKRLSQDPIGTPGAAAVARG